MHQGQTSPCIPAAGDVTGAREHEKRNPVNVFPLPSGSGHLLRFRTGSGEKTSPIAWINRTARPSITKQQAPAA